MLNQTTAERRILFLRLFTRELLKTIKANAEKRGALELKEEQKKRDEDAKKLKEIIKTPEETAKIIKPMPRIVLSPQKYTITPSRTAPLLIQQTPPKLPAQSPSARIKSLTTMRPAGYYTPSKSLSQSQSLDLGKLNPLLSDLQVTMIECPGPNKKVVVKKAGSGVYITNIILAQHEINAVINRFSEKVRIPIMGGIFKAAFENLMISAVISEFVGSRFIITKTSPYSLLEMQNQGARQID